MAMDPSILLFNIPISHSDFYHPCPRRRHYLSLKIASRKTFFFLIFPFFKDYLKSFHSVSILMALHKKLFKKFKEFFSLAHAHIYNVYRDCCFCCCWVKIHDEKNPINLNESTRIDFLTIE